MSPQDRRKLERVAKELEGALILVREILASEFSSAEYPPAVEFDATAETSRLRLLDRSAAESRLSELKQQELGAVFVQSGGPSADKKKPKVWLAEQILWRLFDFERGHEAIRGGGEA
jgi:hypothetical protein